MQELIFRFCFPLPELSNFDRGLYAVEKEDLATGFVRNRNFYWQSSVDTAHRFVHKYNMYGFRDGEWIIRKSAKQRILFAGDSYVESVMSELNLAEYFFSAAGDPAEIEVMNAGMLGIGFTKYLRLMTDMAAIFNPDVLVLVVYSNDFMDKEVNVPSHYKSAVYYDLRKPRTMELFQQWKLGTPVPLRWQWSARPLFAKAGEPGFVWNDFLSSMTDHSEHFLVDAMKAGTFNHHRLNEIKREAFYLSNHHSYETVMDYMRYCSRKFNFEPMVVYIPSRNQITDNYLKYEFQLCKTCEPEMTLTDPVYNQNQINLKNACELSDIPMLDLSDFIRKQERLGNQLYWNYDGHLNEKGTMLIGEEIYRFYHKMIEQYE